MAATKTMLASVGCTSILAIASFIEARFRPRFSAVYRFIHSVTKEILDRISASPIPTYTTFASDGATVTYSR
jgi:hypothetical protein